MAAIGSPFLPGVAIAMPSPLAGLDTGAEGGVP
jgi:hypothetical protein